MHVRRDRKRHQDVSCSQSFETDALHRQFRTQSLPGNHIVRVCKDAVIVCTERLIFTQRPRNHALLKWTRPSPVVVTVGIGHLIVVTAIDTNRVISPTGSKYRPKLPAAVPIPDRGFALSLTSGGEIKTICRVFSVAAAGHDPATAVHPRSSVKSVSFVLGAPPAQM